MADPAGEAAEKAQPLDPADYSSDVVVKDGQTIHLRSIRSDDIDAMMAMWDRLSPETIRFRFFAPRRMSRKQMRYQVEVDYAERFALVAESQGEILGVSRFDRLPDDPATAEFAVIVQDDQQGRGLGTTLLRALMAPARDLGISHFHGDILSENRSMMRVMREEGFEPSFKSYGTTVTATFTTSPTEALLQKAGEQDRRAATAALGSVMHPERVAVVGASRQPRSVGGVVLANLVASGFKGAIYPVNPDADTVQALQAYPDLSSCPEVPDSIYVCVPAARCAAVVDEAGRLGVRAAVIMAADFAEAGPQGQAREDELMAIARSHGIRIIGPNCMGIVNTDPAVALNGSLSPVMPRHGSMALSSQSGTLGLTILAAAGRLGLGFSSFASIGNRADISSNDVLQYWERDPGTKGILLYLESFGNPRKFARLARRIGRSKPIVAVKSGQLHTGATRALFEQAGVIRVATLDQMFNVAKLLSSQPLPAGNRVAVLSNGGGPAALAADACIGSGMVLAELSAATLDVAAAAKAYRTAPVNLHPTTSPEEYGTVLHALLEDPGVDAIVAIFIPPVLVDADAIGSAIADAAVGTTKPVSVVFMSLDEPPDPLSSSGIPTYVFPESAAHAMGLASSYREWRDRDLGKVLTFTDVDVPAARTVIESALEDHAGEQILTAADANSVLESFGITPAPSLVAHTPDQAADIADGTRGSVVIKPAAAIEKAESGLIRLDLAGRANVIDAMTELIAAVPSHHRDDVQASGWLVQEMVPDGIEMIAGVNSDPTFGPIIVTGFGGRTAELLGNVATRIHPLTDVDVDDMLLSLRGYPLLTGDHDSEPLDVPALRVLLLRLAALVEAVPEIVSVDLDPVFVRRHGVVVVDPRIRIAPGRRARDPLSE